MSGGAGFISPAIRVEPRDGGAVAVCSACGHALGPVSEPWKGQAIRRETPLAEAGGRAYDTGDGAVVLRHFFCPGCAALLDTETAMEGDPPLIDTLAGR